jgi:glucose/arabinose dehydrogenase
MRSIFCVLAAVLFAGAAIAEGKTPGYRVETVATGLVFPWSLAFLPDGDVLVTEKRGGLRIVRAGVLDPTPVGGVPASFQQGDCGLLDVVLDPDFAQTRRVFLAFSEGNDAANHVTIWRAAFDGRSLSGGTRIFRSAPDKKAGAHCGGRLAFLPDKTLLLTLGDGFDYRDAAQDLASDLGKVARVTRDGAIPSDNPFAKRAGARAEIFSWGHRNAQGLIVDPRDGTVWLHEHGPKGGDEVNRLKAGANYGWPKTTHGIDYDDTVISELKEAPGIEPPAVVWVPSIAPSGFALYLGDKFPAWRGDFFVGALAEKSLRRVRLRDGRAVEQEVLLRDVDARIRDVRAGPDGFIYVLTDEKNGRLLRLVPDRLADGGATKSCAAEALRDESAPNVCVLKRDGGAAARTRVTP